MSIASTYPNYSSLAGHQMKEGDVNRSEPGNVDPVGSEVVQFFLLIILVIGCGLVSLLGIGSNIVNIFVFIRQGFKDSVNISLFGRYTSLMCEHFLSLTKLLHIVTLNTQFLLTVTTFYKALNIYKN